MTTTSGRLRAGLVPGALLGVACGAASPPVGQAPTPAAAVAADVAAPTVDVTAPALAVPAPAAAPVDAPAPAVVDASSSSSSSSSSSGEESDTGDADAPAADDPLRRTLGGGDPKIVAVVERHPVGRDELVLYRWYGGRAWWAEQRRAGRLEAAQAEVDAQVEACEASEAHESACIVGAIADPYVAWTAALGPVFAWEVARVRGEEVVARARLFDLTLAVADAPHKFKVYDVDGDGRSEVTVIVPVELPDHDEGLEEENGEVAFILEAADLHVQFSATRSHSFIAQDVGGSESSAETVWLARDVDGDGHADLQVRETSRGKDIPEDEDAVVRPPRATTRKTVCPYDAAADLWRCPEALGRQLLPVAPGSVAPR